MNKYAQIDTFPTPERLVKGDVVFVSDHFELAQHSVLVHLFQNAKLGSYPKSVDRLRAGLMFMKDYFYSMQQQSVTSRYDGMPYIKVRGQGGDDSNLSVQAAQDRYLNALKEVGKHKVYALHFLRDEKNVRQFVFDNPILNQGKLLPYRAVYKGINAMLDLLVEFYEKQRQNNESQ